MDSGAYLVMASEETRSFWRYLSGGGDIGGLFKDSLVEIVGSFVVCASLAAVISFVRPGRWVLVSAAVPLVVLGIYGAIDLYLRGRGKRGERPDLLQRLAHIALVVTLAGSFYFVSCGCT